MDGNLNHLADRLRRDPGLLRSLMASQDGRELMQLLTGGQRSGEFRQAAQSAARGDTEQLRRMVQQLMSSGQGAELAERISRTLRNS